MHLKLIFESKHNFHLQIHTAVISGLMCTSVFTSYLTVVHSFTYQYVWPFSQNSSTSLGDKQIDKKLSFRVSHPNMLNCCENGHNIWNEISFGHQSVSIEVCGLFLVCKCAQMHSIIHNFNHPEKFWCHKNR